MQDWHKALISKVKFVISHINWKCVHTSMPAIFP